jgi:hypothetical protein
MSHVDYDCSLWLKNYLMKRYKKDVLRSDEIQDDFFNDKFQVVAYFIFLGYFATLSVT